MITNIEISHYKSISHLNLDLNNRVICIGKNASGKSNFLDAICFLSDIANDGLDNAFTKRRGVKSVFEWSKFKPYDLTISVKLKNNFGSGSYRIQLSSKGDSHIVKSETGLWQWQDEYNDESVNQRISFNRDLDGIVKFRGLGFFKKDKDRSIILNESETLLHTLSTRSIFGRLRILWDELASTKLYKIFPNTVRKPELPNSSSVLESDGSNICRIFKALSRDAVRNRTRKHNIVSGLKVAMPALNNIIVKATGEYTAPYFMIYDDEKLQKSHQFNSAQISDGSLRLFALLVALYQPKPPSILGLEEPEQNINPALLSVVCDAIKEASEYAQVFVSTHSPQLMDEFDLKDMIAFEFDNGITKVGQIEEEQESIVRDGLMTLGELSVADEIRLKNAS